MSVWSRLSAIQARRVPLSVRASPPWAGDAGSRQHPTFAHQRLLGPTVLTVVVRRPIPSCIIPWASGAPSRRDAAHPLHTSTIATSRPLKCTGRVSEGEGHCSTGSRSKAALVKSRDGATVDARIPFPIIKSRSLLDNGRSDVAVPIVPFPSSTTRSSEPSGDRNRNRCGRIRPSQPSAAAATAIASAPLTSRASPVSASSPTTAKTPFRSTPNWPLPASIPSAMGRSNPPASFFKSAGAHFRCETPASELRLGPACPPSHAANRSLPGWWKPELRMTCSTLRRRSSTAAPASLVTGPAPRTSKSTGTASIPTMA